MALSPKLPWPLRLTAWFLLVQGTLSLVGTTLSALQHRLNLDVTIGSLLLGVGLLALNRPIHRLAVALLAVQILMCAWVLRSLTGEVSVLGEGRIFSYLLVELSEPVMIRLMAGMAVVLTFQLVYLLLPGTRRLFRKP